MSDATTQKVKIKKVGPPKTGKHTELGFVKLGGEYECAVNVAEVACRYGEFEPVGDDARDAIDEQRRAVEERERVEAEAAKAKAEADSAKAAAAENEESA